jgi:glutathione S-transferase
VCSPLSIDQAWGEVRHNASTKITSARSLLSATDGRNLRLRGDQSRVVGHGVHMKLYGNTTGSNCRRVTIYLAEKGLNIELVEIDVASGEHKTVEFRAKNPAGLIPVLELDDGSCIPESSAIVEYLEDIHPEPSMIGATPEIRAKVRAVERIASDLAIVAGAMLQHSHPRFAGHIKQVPAVVEVMRSNANQQLAVLEKHIGEKSFLVIDRPTIADVTLFSFTQAFRVRMNTTLTEGYPRLSAWYERFAKRPSAALRGPHE